MRSEHIEDDLLQRYHDGELAAKRSERVKYHLDSCANCQKRLQSLSTLHDLFEIHAEELSRDVDSDLLYRRVTAQIARQEPANVVEKLQAWWDGLRLWKPQVWAPATAVALAGITIAVLNNNNHWRDQKLRTVAKSTKPTVSLVAAAAASTLGSEIVRVDFGDKAGTVFEVALAEGAKTAVVWINDETDDTGMQ